MRTTVRNSYTPKTGEYCNTIVVDNDAEVQYIFDSDGVFTKYTSKTQEGAPYAYVNAKANETLSNAKDYADQKDAEVLAQAKAYTDAHTPTGLASIEYVDQQDVIMLNDAKDYSDARNDTLYGTVTSDISTAVTNLHNQVTGEISQAVQNVPVITMTDIDPGEGAPLAANHFIAVYGGEEESE